MKKDFLSWHLIKQKIHENNGRPFYHEREVWWCLIGANVGFEMDGKGQKYARPVLIIRDFNHATFWAAPITTRLKHTKYHFDIDLNDGVRRQVILSQLRLMDGKRLRSKKRTIDVATFIKIKQTIAAFLA
jgi:mRNA interferase MazF